MGKKIDIGTCPHCGRRIMEHTYEWRCMPEGAPDRPDEPEDLEEFAWGAATLHVMHTKKEDKHIIDAGTVVAESVCNRCWKEGKRFTFKKPSSKNPKKHKRKKP